jgi:hypothetical protein
MSVVTELLLGEDAAWQQRQEELQGGLEVRMLISAGSADYGDLQQQRSLRRSKTAPRLLKASARPRISLRRAVLHCQHGAGSLKRTMHRLADDAPDALLAQISTMEHEDYLWRRKPQADQQTM